jgi:hypothetical protein
MVCYLTKVGPQKHLSTITTQNLNPSARRINCRDCAATNGHKDYYERRIWKHGMTMRRAYLKTLFLNYVASIQETPQKASHCIDSFLAENQAVSILCKVHAQYCERTMKRKYKKLLQTSLKHELLYNLRIRE